MTLHLAQRTFPPYPSACFDGSAIAGINCGFREHVRARACKCQFGNELARGDSK